MFATENNLKAAPCCSLPAALRWVARGLNAFIALALMYLANCELLEVQLTATDYLVLVSIGISVLAITVLYAREFSVALVVLAFGSAIGLAINGQIQPKHGLLVLLCAPAILVWIASRIDIPSRFSQKQLFPDSPLADS